MKKLIVSALLLAASAAFAQPVDMQAVLDECELQMKLGICTVENDRKSYPVGTKFYYGKMQISQVTYETYRYAGTNMCKVAKAFALTDPAGEGWKMAQARWSPNR